MIIHVSGPSGCGKTTLGNKLKKRFGNKIVVKDIDDLRQEFIKDYYGNKSWKIINKRAYQKFLDEFILNQKKPLVLVGLNIMPWWHKYLYYELHADYKFYIKLDSKIICKQKACRLFRDIPKDEKAMKDLEENNKKFLRMVKEAIDRECDIDETRLTTEKLEKDYHKQGYKIMTREDIYHEIVRLLSV